MELLGLKISFHISCDTSKSIIGDFSNLIIQFQAMTASTSIANNLCEKPKMRKIKIKSLLRHQKQFDYNESQFALLSRSVKILLPTNELSLTLTFNWHCIMCKDV